jgi:hypothetical protein
MISCNMKIVGPDGRQYSEAGQTIVVEVKVEHFYALNNAAT